MEEVNSAADPAPISRAAVSRRAEELFEQHRRGLNRTTDRLFSGLLAFEWLAAILTSALDRAAGLGGNDELDPSAHLGGDSSGWSDCQPADRFGLVSARQGLHPASDRRDADADRHPDDPPHRRTDRDPFLHLRVARLSRLLPRLEGPGLGIGRRRRRSCDSRALLAPVRLRCCR